MICNKCGAQVPDGTSFCPTCGSSVTVDAAAQQQMYQPQQYQQPMQMLANSRFDGTVLETFCASLVASLIVTFTFGFGTPWAICYFYRFVLSHVLVDGQRLTFDGTGGQLFGNWVKWFLLTLITFGIYGFWVIPRMFDWVAKHTHFHGNVM